MIGEVISGIGSIIGGGLSYYGAHQTNELTRHMSAEQMAFQERMSNTAHQRAMEDMRRAGLNPILAANLGGSSSPGGAQPQGLMNALGQGLSSALAVRSLQSQLLNQNAQTELTRALTKGAEAEAISKNVRAEVDSSLYGKVNTVLNTLGAEVLGFKRNASIIEALHKGVK